MTLVNHARAGLDKVGGSKNDGLPSNCLEAEGLSAAVAIKL
jgi:hypothetical protein